MTTREPEFISTEEYIDPGDEINAMFDESFTEARERIMNEEVDDTQAILDE